MFKYGRLLCLLICIVLVLSLFIGCTGKEESEKTTEKTTEQNTIDKSDEKSSEPIVAIRHMYNSGDARAEQVEKMVNQFNQENESIKVELELQPWANYLEKLMVYVNADMAPDSAMTQVGWLPTFMATNSLEPMDEYMEKWEYKDDIHEDVIRNFRGASGDNKLYNLPFVLAPLVVYYRIDMFEKENLQPPETWEEFLEVAKKLTKDTDGDGQIDQYGFSMRANMYGHETWFSFAYANLEKPSHFDENGTSTLTTPEAIEGNQFFIDLYKKHKVVPPTAPTDGTAENIAYLASGKAAMMFQHIGTYVNLKAEIGDNLGVFKAPAGKHGGRFSTIGENTWAMFSSSKQKDATFKLLSWMTEPEQHKNMVNNNLTIPFLKSVAAEYLEVPIQKVSYDSLAFGHFVPPTPTITEVATNVWPDLTSKALLGQITSEEMMKELEKAMYGD